MSQQLKTWINPAIDTGERFADELVDFGWDGRHGQKVIVDSVVVRECGATDAHNLAAHLCRVIAAAYEAGREQGRRESAR